MNSPPVGTSRTLAGRMAATQALMQPATNDFKKADNGYQGRDDVEQLSQTA